MACTQCCTEHDADAWAPVRLTWAVIQPGDIILASGTRLPWIVTAVSGAEVIAVRGPATHRATPDPGALVEVLCPVAERAALTALREGLGARITGRGP